MKNDGIEVLNILDWIKKEEEKNDQKHSVEVVLGDWVTLINQSRYATKINQTFYTVNFEIKPTGR